MGDVHWSVVQQFTEAGYRAGVEAQRAAAVAATKRASEVGILTSLENDALPYFESVEAAVDTHDVSFAHEILRKANVAKLGLARVQPPRTKQLKRGEKMRTLDGEIFARKADLTRRLDAVIAKALARVSS